MVRLYGPEFDRHHTPDVCFRDLRYRMTLCIASLEHTHSAIVAVNDTMLTLSSGMEVNFHDDTMTKAGWLSDSWRTMYSGDDTSQLTPLMGKVRDALLKPRDAPRHNFRVIVHVWKSVFRQHWEACLNDDRLTRFGVTLQEFLADRSRFSEAERLRIFEEIANYDIPLEILVYGFDDWPHVFVISSPGRARHYDEFGFWTIGGGRQKQLRVLRYLADHRVPVLDCDEMVVRMCEAKFKCEGDGVGATTLVRILYENNELFLRAKEIDEIRYLWKIANKPLASSDLEAAKQLAQAAINNGKWYSVWQDEVRDTKQRLSKLTEWTPPNENALPKEKAGEEAGE